MQTICHNIINKYHAARVRNDISSQIVAIYCHVVPIWRTGRGMLVCNDALRVIGIRSLFGVRYLPHALCYLNNFL